MREIKFRAWDGERMFYPGDKFTEVVRFDYDRKDGQISSVGIGQRDYEGEVNGYNWYDFHVNEHTLMQFTGCKDKNGVEIYEGDILGWFRPDYGYEVTYMGGGFGMKINGEHQPLGFHTTDFGYVLGNIYQHPHLLD